MKTSMIRRGLALLAALILTLAMTVSADALFGKKSSAAASSAVSSTAASSAVASSTGLVARELEVLTYRNIPYHAQFLSTSAGTEVSYAVESEPKRGTVDVSGSSFVYTPNEGKTGTDSFTYTASDAQGHTSAPAKVTVTIAKPKSGVSYADLKGSPSAAAAQTLAEDGIFTGTQIGDQYFFEPDRTVTRSEFLAMTMETAGLEAQEVTMTGFCDDASIPAWAKSYVSAGVSDGVVEGSVTADGVAFRPEAAISFNEAAAILNRVLAVSDVDLSAWYADRDAVPSWAAQAVGNMESVSVLAAGSYGSERMAAAVTRGDAAQMLCAARTLLEGEDTGVFSWLR